MLHEMREGGIIMPQIQTVNTKDISESDKPKVHKNVCMRNCIGTE